MQNGQITKSAMTLCLFHITINRCTYSITTLSTLSPLLFQEQPYTLASITHPKIRLALLFTKPKQKPMATQNHTGAEAKQIITGLLGIWWVSAVAWPGFEFARVCSLDWLWMSSLSPEASFTDKLFCGAGFEIGLGRQGENSSICSLIWFSEGSQSGSFSDL